MRVRVLPDQLINQISAGEVVERPASVVRELLDNSLDAGSSEITVAIEEGGRTSIRISDNGCGMSRDDALLALERHATSKIRDEADLNAIMTLGFRGEALPSIAAIARVRIKTRSADSETGTEIYIEGGKIRDVKGAACNIGTDIEVSRIFFNTPVRRKFLKSARTEELRIRGWLQNVAIARPNVRLRLFCDGREQLNFPAGQSEKERARLLFKGAHVEFARQAGSLRVSGLVGHPSLALADTASFVVLVNGRVVSDRLIMKAIKEGFDSTLKDREYPVGYASIELPPHEVDVNVHPQKSEVRFINSGQIFQLVRDAVLEAVRSFKSAIPFANSAPTPFAGNATSSFSPRTTSGAVPAWQPAPVAEIPRAPSVSESRQSYGFDFVAQGRPDTGDREERAADAAPFDFRFSDLKYVGQVLACYLVCELRGQLYIVDMHAAHERYNYNLIRNAFEQRTLPVQRLLLPVVLPIGDRGVATVLENAELLNRVGFEFSALGGSEIEVRATPALIRSDRVVDFFKDVAAGDPEAGAEGRYKEMLDHIAARLACHASIRSGKEMTREEVYSLFAAMDSSEFSAACPHGRPVIVSFRIDDIEAWFGRDR